MSQFITIPALYGPAIQVDMIPTFEPDIQAPYTDSNNGYHRTYKMPGGKATTNLKITALIRFPNYTWKETGQTSIAYFQRVSTTFTDLELADGNLTFIDQVLPLQSELLQIIHPAYFEKTLFRFIDGRARLSASNNPRILVVTIKLILGSPDVYVLSTAKSVTPPVSKTSYEAGGEAKIPFGMAVKLGVKGETTSEVTTRTNGLSRTVEHLSQEREWTIFLQLPEPKPHGVVPRAPMWHYVYFLTGRKNLKGPNEGNDPSKFPDHQFKLLQAFMQAIEQNIGFKDILNIELVGHASGLGDSNGNFKLSQQRAEEVKTILSGMTKVPIDTSARGAPPEKNNKDNNPQDRRVDVTVNFRPISY
jgi:hypothetical protein